MTSKDYTSQFSIRAFAPHHQDGVVRLITGIQQDEFGVPISIDDQPDLLDITSFYREGASDFWVAEADGAVIGTIALIDIGDGQGALRKMFVDAAWRGGAGVAPARLDRLLDWARGQDLERVWLGTTALFLAAQRFYEKTGFVEVPETDLPEAFPRMSVDVKFYVITL